MATKRVFVSFDIKHDEDLRDLLVEQSKRPDSPFDVVDWSVKPRKREPWNASVQAKIGRIGLVLVICGDHTHTATGVSTEIEMARKENVAYLLLAGRKKGKCKRPEAGLFATMHEWTWANLKSLVGGAR